MKPPSRGKASIYLICWLLIIGCSSEAPQAPNENLQQLILTESLQLSADSEVALFGNFSGLAVDSQENIYVADRELQKIHLFSPEGAYLESLGGRGPGPAEFSNLDPILRIQADTIYIRDSSSQRITFFDLQSRSLAGIFTLPDASLNGEPMGRSRDMFPVPGGEVLISFINPYHQAPGQAEEPKQITLSLLDRSGRFTEQNHIQFPVLFPTNQSLPLLSSGSINVMAGLTFYPDTKMAMDIDGGLFIGNSDSLSIHHYNSRGEYITTLTAPFQAEELTSTQLDSLAEARNSPTYRTLLDEVFRVAGWPSHWPAFDYFLIDDGGRCWVKLLHPGKDEQAWWVFDRDGEVKWHFLLASEVNLFQIKNGRAYGIHRSSEDLGSIVRYDIEGL